VYDNSGNQPNAYHAITIQWNKETANRDIEFGLTNNL